VKESAGSIVRPWYGSPRAAAARRHGEREAARDDSIRPDRYALIDTPGHICILADGIG